MVTVEPFILPEVRRVGLIKLHEEVVATVKGVPTDLDFFMFLLFYLCFINIHMFHNLYKLLYVYRWNSNNNTLM